MGYGRNAKLTRFEQDRIWSQWGTSEAAAGRQVGVEW